jgi:hypothetical protein
VVFENEGNEASNPRKGYTFQKRDKSGERERDGEREKEKPGKCISGDTRKI